MISLRRTLSCLAGLAMLTSLQTAYAQNEEPDKACQTYFCMISAEFLKEPTCPSLITDVFNTFLEGDHTVGCGDPSPKSSDMAVTHRKATKDYCRPDLKDDKGECRAEAVIDVYMQNKLFTRQWKLKSEDSKSDSSTTDNPPITQPLTEYYEGKSAPNYSLEGSGPPSPTTPKAPTAPSAPTTRPTK